MSQKVSVFGKRYIFEHKYLPQMIYQLKDEFIVPFLKDKNHLSKLFNTFCVQVDGNRSPYRRDEFGVRVVEYDDDVLCIALTFPEPEDTPLCRNAFLFVTEGFENICYYTLERAKEESDPEEYGMSFICAWFEGAHLNFGRHRVDAQEAMDTCYELFDGSRYGLEYILELDKCRNVKSNNYALQL